AHEEPRDAERILIIDRYAPFEVAAEIKAVRPQCDATDCPIAVLLALPFAHALVNEAVREFLEFELEMLWRRFRRSRFLALSCGPIVVHPFEVDRIAGIFLALKPVARHVGENDFAKAVRPRERLPHRQLGRRQRPHIGPQQARQLAHRISPGAATLLGAVTRVGDILVRLLDASTCMVHEPAMVAAADALSFDPSVGEVRTSMRAMTVDESVAATQILVEPEVLSHQPYRLDRRLIEFACSADRHPVATQKIAHRSPRPDARQQLVLRSTEHP